MKWPFAETFLRERQSEWGLSRQRTLIITAAKEQLHSGVTATRRVWSSTHNVWCHATSDTCDIAHGAWRTWHSKQDGCGRVRHSPAGGAAADLTFKVSRGGAVPSDISAVVQRRAVRGSHASRHRWLRGWQPSTGRARSWCPTLTRRPQQLGGYAIRTGVRWARRRCQEAQRRTATRGARRCYTVWCRVQALQQQRFCARLMHDCSSARTVDAFDVVDSVARVDDR